MGLILCVWFISCACLPLHIEQMTAVVPIIRNSKDKVKRMNPNNCMLGSSLGWRCSMKLKKNNFNFTYKNKKNNYAI